jgi:gliding motility-associated lipoprotein GldH
MRSNNSLIYFTSILLFFSCQGGQSFHFDHDFGKEMMWSEPLKWKWDVQKNDKPYQLTMDLQCGIHYPYENLPISWIEIQPDGDSITHELEIIVRNPDGTFNGDKALDYLNFDVVLADKMIFDTFGEYQFVLQQKTGLDSAPFMVNLEITAEELDNY